MNDINLIIHSKLKDYSVITEESFDFLAKIITEDNTEFVIDSNVYELYNGLFEHVPSDRLFLVNAIEENKVIDTVLSICEEMTKIPAKRNAHLVSIGGGIIQDITGFVSTILYRGIRWTFVPTTLLAACDSCIGGKTSLNYKKYKNLLGSFYPPDEIISCPLFFRTLSQRDYESGLGEVIKFNIMTGTDGLDCIEHSIDKLLNRDESALVACVERCLSFKKSFIEVDEFDRKERIKLNFAHTFGHGIETVTNYGIPHGTAVAIGMIMANSISVSRGLLDKDFARRSEQVLIRVIHTDVDLRNYSFDDLLTAIRKDKKQIGKSLTAVLLTDKPYDLIVVHDIEDREIRNAVTYFCEKYY